MGDVGGGLPGLRNARELSTFRRPFFFCGLLIGGPAGCVLIPCDPLGPLEN